MRLIAVGSASAFTVGGDNFQSNFLLETDDGQRLMIDCGTDGRHALHRLGLGASDISAVYATHLHFDHVGGLEWFAFSTFFNPTLGRPRLFLHRALDPDLWETVLSGSLRGVEGAERGLETYFDVQPVDNGTPFTFGRAQLTPFPVTHVVTSRGPEPSTGLMIRTDYRTVMITGDTQFTPDTLIPLYQQADLILHDCETCPPSGIHAQYADLCGLPADIKARMWLYHYHTTAMPDAQADGFAGLVMRGQSFELAAPHRTTLRSAGVAANR